MSWRGEFGRRPACASPRRRSTATGLNPFKSTNPEVTAAFDVLSKASTNAYAAAAQQFNRVLTDQLGTFPS
jgi:hypothetical protein